MGCCVNHWTTALFLLLAIVDTSTTVEATTGTELKGASREGRVHRSLSGTEEIITIRNGESLGPFSLSERQQCKFGLYGLEPDLDVTCHVTCLSVGSAALTIGLHNDQATFLQSPMYGSVEEPFNKCPLTLTTTSCATGNAFVAVIAGMKNVINDFNITCTTSPTSTPSTTCDGCFGLAARAWKSLFGN